MKSVTLSDGATWKGCRERYGIIIETLNKMIFRAPKPELIGYRIIVSGNKTLKITSSLAQKHNLQNNLSSVCIIMHNIVVLRKKKFVGNIQILSTHKKITSF